MSLESVRNVQQLLENALTDTLAQRNSLQRSRTIGYLLGYAMKLLEISQLEERVSALEQLLATRSNLSRVSSS